MDSWYGAKTLDRRLCTGRSGEAVVIFLFGLEALLTRDSRVLSCVVSPPPNYRLLLATTVITVSIGSHNSQTSFQSSSLYLRALGKHCFVKMSSSTLCCTVFLYNVFGYGVSAVGGRPSLPFPAFYSPLPHTLQSHRQQRNY